jgi:hypothetical protein
MQLLTQVLIYILLLIITTSLAMYLYDNVDNWDRWLRYKIINAMPRIRRSERFYTLVGILTMVTILAPLILWAFMLVMIVGVVLVK